MQIRHYIQWRQDKVLRDGQLLLCTGDQDCGQIPQSVYRRQGITYPKFFKMDPLSRVAFLAAELLVDGIPVADKHKVATVLATSSGCLEVDKKFEESRKELASPALFVYTLPNIMLGEIDIRHGFKGEQMCTVSGQPDPEWLLHYVTDLLQHRGTEACLCGYVEATAQTINATLLWVDQTHTGGTGFDLTTLISLFNLSPTL